MGYVGGSPVPGSPVSERARAVASAPPHRKITEFLRSSAYSRHQNDPGITDFALGNHQQMSAERDLEALQKALTPGNEAFAKSLPAKESAR